MTSSRRSHLTGLAREHLGEFSERDMDVRACASRMIEYCRGDGVAWLEQWMDPRQLLNASSSPLGHGSRTDLIDALSGIQNPAHVRQSDSHLMYARSRVPCPALVCLSARWYS